MTRTKQKQKVTPPKQAPEKKKEAVEEVGTTTTTKAVNRKDTKSSTQKGEPDVDKAPRPAPLSPLEEASVRIEDLKKEILELNDRLLRKIAEFDNYRKRTAREQISLLESAAGPLLLKLLPILDDMEQLEKLAPEQATIETLLKGLTLIHKKVSDTLRKEGLESIPAAGEQFDPELHEVLAVMEDSEQKPGVILVEQQKGYRLKGRILRHSRVVINKDEE
jgi:molecular chaperone GrpE